jgi:ParB-like chromosome segregation protein Spo0J
VAGHGRLAAARQLGLSDVPVIALQGLTDLQRRQLMLADNRIALNAGCDIEMLHLELKDLSALGADLALVGFTTHELVAALAPAVSTGLTDENEALALAETALRPQSLYSLQESPENLRNRYRSDRGTGRQASSLPLAPSAPR